MSPFVRTFFVGNVCTNVSKFMHWSRMLKKWLLYTKQTSYAPTRGKFLMQNVEMCMYINAGFIRIRTVFTKWVWVYFLFDGGSYYVWHKIFENFRLVHNLSELAFHFGGGPPTPTTCCWHAAMITVVYTGFREWGRWSRHAWGVLFYIGEIKNFAFFQTRKFSKNVKKAMKIL